MYDYPLSIFMLLFRSHPGYTQLPLSLNHYMTFIPTEIIKDWIVKPLKDQHVKPKATATFKCELFKDTPNWKWLKGENEITPSDKVEIKKDGKELMLTIKNCQPDDIAEYSLEVEGRIYTAKLTLGGLNIYKCNFSLIV